MGAPVEVAVAILIRDDGSVLLAKRPVGKVYAGYWEFPGGKVEPGESVREALVRELQEELALESLERAYPWITQEFVYPHATVRLHFHRVLAWRGTPQAAEHEALIWEMPGAVSVTPLLPANGPVLKALQLPHAYAITQAGELGETVFLERLRKRLAGGLRLVQVREPTYDNQALSDFAVKVVALARAAGAQVLINADAELAREVGADGIHMSSRQVAYAKVRPDFRLVGASAHDAAQLGAAARLGVDFAVLGPVCRTLSHPERTPIGWDAFRNLVTATPIPVFALGGVGPAEMETAWSSGAHGVAMIRAAWTED